MRLYLGGYSTFLGVPLWTQSERNIDEAVRFMVDAVMKIDERTLEQGYGESVKSFKYLKSLIDMVKSALEEIKNKVIPEARRNSRTFLLGNTQEWDNVLEGWIKELSTWSDAMTKVLGMVGAPPGGEIGAVLEMMKEVADGAQSKLKEVVTELKEKLVKSWKLAALATAERLIQNLSYVLSNRDATEFLRWLFGSRSAKVEFVGEIGGELRGEEEGEVIVATTEEVPISERLEEALFRLLGYVAEIWKEGDKNAVADKFLEAISGLVDIFGVSQDNIREKLLGILNEIERGTYVPDEVAKSIPNSKKRIRFAQELKALLSSTPQQIEPLAPPPMGPEEEVEPVGPEEEGAAPTEGGAPQEGEVGRGEQSGVEEEEEEEDKGRLLLAKFYFLAKALRVFP
jgi:hypothetical protein